VMLRKLLFVAGLALALAAPSYEIDGMGVM
jgi:hypothetical protein